MFCWNQARLPINFSVATFGEAMLRCSAWASVAAGRRPSVLPRLPAVGAAEAAAATEGPTLRRPCQGVSS